MKLDREDVLRIAELAKIGTSEEEAQLFAEQLSAILNHVGKLDRLDTDTVPPTTQAIPTTNVTRPDTVRPFLPPETALANAPQRQDDLFRVRPILE